MPSYTVPFLDLVSSYRVNQGAIDAALQRVAGSGWYLLGDELAAFEAHFAEYCSARHCVAMANGLDALHLILRAYGIGPGDEVIVPSNTYIASWLAVSQAGAVPVVPWNPCSRLRTLIRPGRGRDYATHAGHHAGPSLRTASRHDTPDGHRGTTWSQGCRGRSAGARRELSRHPQRSVGERRRGASIRARTSARMAMPAR